MLAFIKTNLLSFQFAFTRSLLFFHYSENPVNVGVSMYILSIHSFSEADMEYTMDFYFRQFWNDPRLAFKKTQSLTSITPGYEYGRGLWLPDTFFQNEKESFLHTMSTKNEFVRIDYNGNVVRSIRWVDLMIKLCLYVKFRN